MKSYRSAYFYKLYKINIKTLVVCLKERFPIDIKYEFVCATYSENLYSEESILKAVSLVCNTEVKTLEDAEVAMVNFEKMLKRTKTKPRINVNFDIVGYSDI